MGKRDEVRRENKDINRPVLFNRINFMAVYLIGIYLPYILYLSVKFDIAEISLSRIGWRMNGFPFLLVYCGLTIPFMISARGKRGGESSLYRRMRHSLRRSLFSIWRI